MVKGSELQKKTDQLLNVTEDLNSSGQKVPEKRAEKADHLVETYRDELRTLRETGNSVENIAESAVEIADSTARLFETAAQAYETARELDATVEKYRLDAELSLQKLEKLIDTVEPRLESLSKQADRLMDRVLEIDPGSCSDQAFEHRKRLTQQARDLNQKTHDLLMKLMSV